MRLSSTAMSWTRARTGLRRVFSSPKDPLAGVETTQWGNYIGQEEAREPRGSGRLENPLDRCFVRNTGPDELVQYGKGPSQPVFGSWNWNVVHSAVSGGTEYVHALQMRELARVDIVTFNMLAPCYRRLTTRDSAGRRLRESHEAKSWMPRAELAFRFLQEEVMPNTSIVALQEFWLGNEQYKSMFFDEFEKRGFSVSTLQRTGDKADAVVLLARTSEFDILGQRNLFLQSAERVALLLWLQHKATGKHIFVANTHLSFPHTSLDRIFQMRQVSSLVAEMDDFELKSGLTSATATRVVLGDFNVETHSPVCAHLRQAGYVSGMATALETGHTEADARLDELLVEGLSASASESASGHESGGGRGGALPSSATTSSNSTSTSTSTSTNSSSSSSSSNSKSSNSTSNNTPSLEHDRSIEEREEYGGSAVQGLGYGDRNSSSSSSSSSSSTAQNSNKRWVSHRTHRAEELGVDHIFVKPEVEIGPAGPEGGVFVSDARILPVSLPATHWPMDFRVSDHRPVKVSLVFGRLDNQEWWGEN